LFGQLFCKGVTGHCEICCAKRQRSRHWIAERCERVQCSSAGMSGQGPERRRSRQVHNDGFGWLDQRGELGESRIGRSEYDELYVPACMSDVIAPPVSVRAFPANFLERDPKRTTCPTWSNQTESARFHYLAAAS
jgi:hypothetical protein